MFRGLIFKSQWPNSSLYHGPLNTRTLHGLEKLGNEHPVREHNIPEEWSSDNKLPIGMCPGILNSLVSVQLLYYTAIAILTFITARENVKKLLWNMM